MKKISVLLILCQIIFGALCNNAYCEESMTISASNAVCRRGNTVEVSIQLSNNTGFSDLGIEVLYNNEVMTLIGAENKFNCIFTHAESYDAIPYNMGWSSLNDVVQNGTLATLVFKVKETASYGIYPINISYYKGTDKSYVDGIDVNYNRRFEPLLISYESGYVTVPADGSTDIKVNNFKSDNGISFDTSLPENSGGKLIAVLYDEENILRAVKIRNGAGEFSFGKEDTEGIKTVSLLWWNGTDTLVPLSKKKVVEIQ